MIRENKYFAFSTDNSYQTGLHWASKRGYTTVIEILLKNWAFVDAKDMSGRTPLYLAVRASHV